jgi:hypothetical protein
MSQKKLLVIFIIATILMIGTVIGVNLTSENTVISSEHRWTIIGFISFAMVILNTFLFLLVNIVRKSIEDKK